jgi:hypothetical protein
LLEESELQKNAMGRRRTSWFARGGGARKNGEKERGDPATTQAGEGEGVVRGKKRRRALGDFLKAWLEMRSETGAGAG